MDMACDEALLAREHLLTHGWIAPGVESFRHLPPPGVSAWLGGGELADAGDMRGGWTFDSLPGGTSGNLQVRLLDARDARQRQQLLADLAPPADDEAAPFAWAHRALLQRGLRLEIAAGAETTWLHLAHQPSLPVEAPLLVLDVHPGARCVLLEAHAPAAAPGLVQNLQVHVRLGAGASLQHLRIVRPGAGEQRAHQVHLRAERDARYAQFLLAAGCGYHLQRNVFELQGPGAEAQAGAVVLGTDSVLDLQMLAHHAAPRTRSGFEVLALARGAARLVANARTHIAPGCDDAQTRQRLAGIPTGGQPKLVLRPHLEIHHDQVQAAHGATWGAVPEEALFLARQRGLDEVTARALILTGLAQAVLARTMADTALPGHLRVEADLAAAVASHLGAAAPAQEDFHG
ncbi:SufD family Fe-S cluster assembly protein [Ramlibacter monticola]|uniref:SufD family Fe-S cluster assembly protein n=1 Tax=Ramlibacter monticola TaxID=1926872 RepID=A0A937CUT5_9BURK|nr:SufD family Fe-S cluster assembly protein [Ramlibacter monticola]MBL0394005.1 SufD family Fe-S cluster assembly protein [Ramlibacter monticola]